METCGEENPYQVITSTKVNGAHESDQKAVLPMLDRLEQSKMMPEELIADTGYGSGENIVESAKRGVNLQAPVQNPDVPPTTDHFVAPVADDVISAVPREPGAATDAASGTPEPEHALGLEAFTFDPTSHEVRECPAGKEPACQHMAGNQLVATFSAEHCGSCPLRARCPTRALSNGDRQLRRSSASIATEVRQAEQQSPAFKERYRIRSGIESTNEERKGSTRPGPSSDTRETEGRVGRDAEDAGAEREARSAMARHPAGQSSAVPLLELMRKAGSFPPPRRVEAVQARIPILTLPRQLWSTKPSTVYKYYTASGRRSRDPPPAEEGVLAGGSILVE